KTLAKISRECPVLGKAFGVLEQFKYSPEEQERYDVRDMNASAIATSISDAKKEGLAEGKAKATRKMIMKLHQQGVDKNIIATAAQLSLAEVERIIAEVASS
ncbi:MAG: hypothetical protein LBD40_03960, partial [Puniceicoccales bacterium]|nr:hypothetical protein [Puniceicoccales bacterium]